MLGGREGGRATSEETREGQPPEKTKSTRMRAKQIGVRVAATAMVAKQAARRGREKRRSLGPVKASIKRPSVSLPHVMASVDRRSVYDNRCEEDGGYIATRDGRESGSRDLVNLVRSRSCRIAAEEEVGGLSRGAVATAYPMMQPRPKMSL